MTPTLAALALASLWCLAWAPFFWCCCGPATCTTTVYARVAGCLTSGSVWIPGITIAIKVGGVTVGTGTSVGGSSYVAISAVAASGASATVVLSGYATGYVQSPLPQTITLNCGSVFINCGLAVTAGYRCCTNLCCPEAGNPPYAIVAWNNTATINDGFGDITLTKFEDNSTNACTISYTGYATRNASYARICSTDPDTYGAADIDIGFKLICDDGVWYLLLSVYLCNGTKGCYDQRNPVTQDYSTYAGENVTPGSGFYTIGDADGKCHSAAAIDSRTEPVPCEMNTLAVDFNFTFKELSTFGTAFNYKALYYVYGDTQTMSASI